MREKLEVLVWMVETVNDSEKMLKEMRRNICYLQQNIQTLKEELGIVEEET